MQRMGMVIGLKPDAVTAYKKLHAAVWPEILDQLRQANIRNFSIFLKEPENLLFGYFEYVGQNFPADQARLAADPKNQDWQTLCMPLQKPLETRGAGEWWAVMDVVFHAD